MKTGFIPWSEVVLEDALRYQRAACFTLGCLEREHRLNVDALMAYWAHAAVAWWVLPLVPYPRAARRLNTGDAPSATMTFLRGRSAKSPLDAR
jgi:hypothetical protein